MTSIPTPHTALDVARDSGEPVSTSPIKLVQERGGQTSILVFLPIYSGGDIPAQLSERRATLLGYAAGVFRMGDVLAAALNEVFTSNIEAQLLDTSPTGTDQYLALLGVDAQGEVQFRATDQPAAPETGLSWSAGHEFGGRTWRLVLSAMPQYAVDRRSWPAWGVLAGGLAFTSLLGAFLLILTGRSILDQHRADQLTSVNRSLEQEVRRRELTESALHAEKERAEITLQSIGDAVITTDTEGRIDLMNPVAERLTEWNTPDLLSYVNTAFGEYNIAPEQVCFEITETAVIRNLTAAAHLITSVRNSGAHFALDDFGSGLCSFAYLKHLPVDYLKIDGTPVRNISDDDNDRAMVEAVNQVAHRLGTRTVAEYVDSEATPEVLRELGVDFAQGNLLGGTTLLPVTG